MAKINGVDITVPESQGGGAITNQLMGIFRERTRAQQQLQMMAYGSALDVASKAAETEVTSDIARKALVKDFRTIYGKYGKNHPKAGQYRNPELAKHVSESGLEATPAGYKFSPSSLTKAEMMRRGVGPFEQYAAPAPAAANVTTGPEKPSRAKKTATAPAPAEGATEQPAKVVNASPQPVVQPNVGSRTPSPSKGGFKQMTLPGMGKVSRTPKKPTTPPAGGSSLGMGDMPNA